MKNEKIISCKKPTRLTKLKDNKYLLNHSSINEVIEKLGKLEDFEEKFGADFFDLFRILDVGGVIKTENKISEIVVDKISFCYDYDGNKYYIEFNYQSMDDIWNELAQVNDYKVEAELLKEEKNKNE